jgi:hypothetical protein
MSGQRHDVGLFWSTEIVFFGRGERREPAALTIDSTGARDVRWDLYFLKKLNHYEQHIAFLLRPGVGAMDSEFIKQRAARCRFPAEKADPLIKRRLLDLAAKYEAEFPKKPSQISINLTAQVVPLATPRNQ